MVSLPTWETLNIRAKPTREAFASWSDSDVERFFRLVRSGQRAARCADSPDGQHQLQMDTNWCRYCHRAWAEELGYAAPVTTRPRMMDAQAQSCTVSADGFHWVGSTPVCRLCGSPCGPLPQFPVDQGVVDQINADIAARAKAAAMPPPVPCRERWAG